MRIQYGPLIYITEQNESGNYSYTGNDPVAYNSLGIPVDEFGVECLESDCPLHPFFTDSRRYWSDYLEDYIPTVQTWKQWFEANFIEISEDRCKREIVRALVKRYELTNKTHKLVLFKNRSVDEMVDILWPQNV